VLSVVVPIYNEDENIVAFHAALEAVLNRLDDMTRENWEVVYVNDGSRDTSLSLLLEIHSRDPRVVVVEFARNFGHQAALSAGLRLARGDAIVLMDGDFQDPPDVLPSLVSAWKNGGKVVIAERASRAEKGVRGKLFPLFYKVLGWLSDFPIPLNAGIFGLLDRQAADAINHLREGNRYLPGMRAWIGFPTAVVSYDRADRAAGEAKQTLVRLIKYAMDAIFSFSYKPLRLGLALGSGLLITAMLISAVTLAGSLSHLQAFAAVRAGSTIMVLALLIMGGVQLICTGLIGEYIGRIYDEVRRRPLYLIDKLHRAETVPPPAITQETLETTVRVEVAAPDDVNEPAALAPAENPAA
jgi:dolichol-phosphate mannosyltransferase